MLSALRAIEHYRGRVLNHGRACQRCDYFNTFSAVLDWWFLSKPECQKLSYLVSRVLDLKDTATLQFTNLLFNYRSGILSEN